jgi:hypothetical protein
MDDDDLCYEPYAPVAVALAKSILSGEMPIVEGCYEMWKPLHELFSENDAAFSAFGEVRGFTSGFPMSKDRHLWNPQVVAEKDALLEAWLPTVQDNVHEACREVIRRFTPPATRYPR